MKTTRRQLIRNSMLAGAAAVPAFNVLLRSRAEAAEFTLKVGNSFQATHPTNVRIAEAGQKIQQESGGRVEIRLFPDSQLGSDPQMIEQCRSGALEICVTSVLFVDSLVPQVNASGLGFAFNNLDQVWSAWDGDFGDYIRKQFPSKVGVMVFDKVFDNGFREVTSSKRPVYTPEDLSGMKVRIPPEEILTSLFSHLGASPATIAIKETYSALQTHLVDAQENDLAHIEFWKFYEVAKYCSMTNHMWDGLWPFANLAVMNKMPSNLRDMVITNFNAAAVKQRADMLALNQSLRSKIEKTGMKFNDTDPTKFRAVLRKTGYYKEWKTKLGSQVWSLIERHTSALG